MYSAALVSLRKLSFLSSVFCLAHPSQSTAPISILQVATATTVAFVNAMCLHKRPHRSRPPSSIFTYIPIVLRATVIVAEDIQRHCSPHIIALAHEPPFQTTHNLWP